MAEDPRRAWLRKDVPATVRSLVEETRGMEYGSYNFDLPGTHGQVYCLAGAHQGEVKRIGRTSHAWRGFVLCRDAGTDEVLCDREETRLGTYAEAAEAAGKAAARCWDLLVGDGD